MKPGVTIHHVSRRAGVSLSTVSRVLNGSQSVNAELRERVMRAAQELGYQPNHAARTLKTSRSRMIVFVMPEISNPYYTEIYRGIHSIAEERGYLTLVYETHDLGVALQTVMSRGADGLIIDAVYYGDSIGDLLQTGHPFVVTNAPATLTAEHSAVRVDVFGATLKVLDYLALMGHRRIGLIVSSPEVGRSIDERERAFRVYAESHGVASPERFIAGTVGLRDKSSGGYAGMRELLRRKLELSAVITLNDFVALGAIAAAEAAGIRVPADISIVGFDNADIARHTTPPLTTVNIPAFQQGEIAGRMLFDRLENPDREPYTMQVLTDLVVRDSVAPTRDQA